jgi:amino acid adenylation domain-containing protein/FkbH-like protein/thioester reductase-like protein
MNNESVRQTELQEGALPFHEQLIGEERYEDRASALPENTRPIVISATFTTDLLQRGLALWMQKLDIAADVVLAPYGQVMQEMLNPGSVLAQNTTGFNVVLLRLEDWIRDRLEAGTEQNVQHLCQAARDFLGALESLRAHTTAPALIMLCPSSSSLPDAYRNAIVAIEGELSNELAALAGVHCWTHADVALLYPVAVYEDSRLDEIGHIPYTSEYFAAIATFLARRVAMLLKPAFKVIAVDCDNTLWKGICGEDGAAGVEVTPAHRRFQEMLVRQYEAGVLLCLCSKNNAADVEDVFRAQPHMPLRAEHLVSSRVNWSAKSTNLQSLAAELELSLDSFVLIDDSPTECAEVQAHCPAVLTLQFPQSAEEIAHFLHHIWAFDRVTTTHEGRQRTLQYQQNRARKQASEEAHDFVQFLRSLEVQVDVAPLQSGQLRRVAELIQRTNQFNLTAIRRSQADLEGLCRSAEIHVLVVHVRDRFGDYGLVGAVLYRCVSSSLEVDTFVLSCRVLGRGVEYCIVNELGRIARLAGLPHVVLGYRQTPRNAPAWSFLEQFFARFAEPSWADSQGAATRRCRVPAEYAEHLRYEPSAAAATAPAGSASPQATSSVSHAWHDAAYRFSRVEDFVQEIARSARPVHATAQYLGSLNETESAVAGLWADLLGVAQVGLDADFFNLGGDSLLAVQVIARLESELGWQLSLYDFLEGPTVRQVAAKLSGTARSRAVIESIDRTRPLPLSPAQERLWFIDQLEGGIAAYRIPLAIRMTGRLDRRALQAALDALIQRHETLRTVFLQIDGQPMQQIAQVGGFELGVSDLTTIGVAERAVEARRCAQEALAVPFDLSTGPLIRGTLLQLSDHEYVLLMTMHHIVADGWSLGVLLRDLSSAYQAFQQDAPDPLAPLPIQYADYARWQREAAAQTQQDDQLAYWIEHLRGAPELLELPTDRPRPPVQSYRGANARVALGAELTSDLRAFCRERNLTMAMVLYAAWAVVLARLSGQEDLVIGMPVANRRRTEVEGLIGLFVNTLAVRVTLDDDPLVSELLARVKEIMLAAYAHQDVPFERVVETLQPARTLSHSSIFQVLFVLHNAPRGKLELPGLMLAEEEVLSQAAHFDLTLSLQESAEGLCGVVNYASDLFDARTIERWVESFKVMLCGIIRQSGQNIRSLALMHPDDHQRIVAAFNDTRVDYPHDKLIHELFEEQVERSPEAIAVVHEGQSLTYRELNNRANQLAWYLRARGIGPDQLVALCVERSVEMLVALLGILKAGGAYVPLDPSNPQERLEHLLSDARPLALLTQERLKPVLPLGGAPAIALDSEWSELAQYDTRNPQPRAVGLSSRHLAYVIYTSGSTGKPKGVMVEHRSIVNYALHIVRQLDVAAGQGSLVCTSISFDLMLTGLYPPLLCGRTVRLCREQHGLPALVEEILQSRDLAPLKLTPSHLALLDEPLRNGQLANRIRALVLGGEPLHADALRVWRELSPDTRIFNHYGPTETTVGSVTNEIALTASGAVAIGRPISNTRVYILDRHRQVVPIGVTGEIYIGGAGVARGYLNRPDLSAERFVPDVYGTDPHARMYKTGDLGRWRDDGTIECLGRNDDQVKLRGFRVELGEVEAQLRRHEQVEAAAVIMREDVPGEKRLVAYIACREGHGPTVESLRAHMKRLLPDYLVPGAFVVLDRLPLTANGKLERRSLPTPELGSHVVREYEVPRAGPEEILAGIWQALLRVERVGRKDNFFELGGHSLLIVQMLDRLRRLGLRLELRHAFEAATLADLADVLTREVDDLEVPPNRIPVVCNAITPQMLPLVELQQEQIDSIVQSVPGGAANIQDIYPLTPLQEGILFHHLLNETGWDAYVSPIVLVVASRRRLDDLIAALNVVIARHDVLRTSILWEKLPRALQVVHRQATLPVTEVVLDAKRDALAQVRRWAEPERQCMELHNAPLLRLQVAIDHDGEQWYALLQRHHVVSDHVTLETVISEVVEILEGRVAALPRPAQYRDHVARTLTYARRNDAEAFFRGKLATVEEPTAPFELLNVHGDGSRIEECREDLDADLARRTRAQARRLGTSPATLFHAAWALVVAHTSAREDVVFGSVLLGRLQAGAAAQRTLGMFINTLPLRVNLHGLDAAALVDVVQRELVELLGQEQASLAIAQRCSGITGQAPLFTALFNYRHSRSDTAAQWTGASGVRELACDERTNYPLTFSVDDYGGAGFGLKSQTDRQLDPRRLVGYMRTAIASLVEALEHAPERPALELEVMPASERHQTLTLFNATQMDYPQDKLVHELFEEQVRRGPCEVAVEYGQQRLSYRDLNARANQVAHLLKRLGAGPDVLVGVLVERSLEMVIGQLAVLKSGAAYVPLDPSYPADRLRHILLDSSPLVILTLAHLREYLPQTAARVIALDSDWSEIATQPDADLDSSALGLRPEHLAYIVYTSGSTGVPKGAMVEHRSLNNFVHWHRAAFDVRAGTHCSCMAAVGFDATMWELWPALSVGGTVMLAPAQAQTDADALLSWWEAQPVEVSFMSTPIGEFALARNRFNGKLRTLVVGGDTLRYRPTSRAFSLFNNYGPTETTVIATSGRIHVDEPALHIGRPIANGKIYILDTRRRPVPVGVSGEMYIGGAGVGRGYLKRPDLTAERFVADPFTSTKHARMYKTGDLARWRPDGTIEFLGRNDHQVKIRGFRIELGEIEAHLARHEQVKDVVVVARQDVPGEKRLVAYLTAADSAVPLTVEALRRHLVAIVPQYMVPSAFMILPSLPLSPNGKIDRRALPAPELAAYAMRSYEPPDGDLECALAQIWQELLQVKSVGRDDNFFDLGGHSLSVLRLAAQVNQSLGCALKVADVYKNPTIKELAGRIRGAGVEDELIDLSREAAVDPQIIARPTLHAALPTQAVLLTGATGFVGRFLLTQLLRDTPATVHCLVKGPRSKAALRIRETLANWDLWREDFEQRIVAIPGDLRLPRLGIEDTTYSLLAERVDSIYHCATSMNHLETYAMAKRANVESARELLKFATRGNLKLVNYVSTLGVFSSSEAAAHAVRVVNEASSIDRERHWASRGYTASKWVGEKIFMTGAQLGVPCNIFRLGLVWADAQRGRYDELQTAYRVLKSCLMSGCGIENYRHPMAPTPVDYVARAIAFLANRHRDGNGIFHIAGRAPALDGVFERCNEIAGTALKLLPHHAWICEMKRLHCSGRSLPAVPLIEYAFSMDEAAFHEHQRRAGLDRMRFDCSRTYAELEPEGIVAPALDDALLRVCLQGMAVYDTELRDLPGMRDQRVSDEADPPPHRAGYVSTPVTNATL